MGRSHEPIKLRYPPDYQRTRQKSQGRNHDTANVVSMTPLTEFEYNGEHYLRQRVNDNHRFATIRKR